MTDKKQKKRSADDAEFAARIAPVVEKLEKRRKILHDKYLWRRKFLLRAALPLFLVTLGIDFGILTERTGINLPLLTFAAAAAVLFWLTAPQRHYKKNYKKGVLPQIAGLFGDFRYFEDGRIPISEIEPSLILPKHDRYTSEDMFEGRYKETGIRFAEILLEEQYEVRVTGYKGKTKYRTEYRPVFQGLAVLIDLRGRRFSSHTIIIRNKTRFFEWIKERKTGLRKAGLVDPEFEKRYDAYTNDQVEARYLIDPVMIERIRALNDIYSTDGISLAYFDNKLLIMIPSRKNMFEPANISIRAVNMENLRKLKQEIAQVLRLIDHLILRTES